MAQDQPPTIPGPRAAVCYRCGEPLKGVCAYCGRFFCYQHGNVFMRACQRHRGTVLMAAFAATALLLVGTILAALWHLK
jgi:hypothetical protein